MMVASGEASDRRDHQPVHNESVIVEFVVADVDAEFARLRDALGDIVLEPTTMPWGNRSAMFRDPDGNLVNLFSRAA
jgi:predicted enzyme related to lactoylglutathione lyase